MAHLEILIGAAAAFMLGFLWYTALFGKAWQAETGISDEDAQKDSKSASSSKKRKANAEKIAAAALAKDEALTKKADTIGEQEQDAAAVERPKKKARRGKKGMGKIKTSDTVVPHTQAVDWSKCTSEFDC